LGQGNESKGKGNDMGDVFGNIGILLLVIVFVAIVVLTLTSGLL